MMMADEMQAAAAAAFADLPTVNVQAFDGLGRAAGNRPGFCYAEKPTAIVDDRTATNVAYDVHDAHTAAAWRRPDAIAPVQATDKEAAYAEHAAELQDAWRAR
jgi:hypothetical protein